ncbi:hypothetical protein [Labilibaculum sp.]|uniref:hypothetical protein n=1 Tax=Labilibaculum sp. TaxID=2060723 RepID=UPI0035646520
MELGKAITGLIMLACFIVPIIILGFIKKRNKKQIVNSLSDFAKQNHCIIDEYEFCSNFVIGIDKIHNFIFFLQKYDQENKIKQINLSEIKSSKKLITKHGHNIISRLDLLFYPLSKNADAIDLEFYNSEQSFELNDELQTLEKWSKIVANQLQ